MQIGSSTDGTKTFRGGGEGVRAEVLACYIRILTDLIIVPPYSNCTKEPKTTQVDIEWRLSE